jgi:DNA primase
VPICDEQGRLVAYDGRWIGPSETLPEGEGKWKQPPRFRKSHVLYNLHRLPSPVGHVVLVEAYWSVFRLHSRGVPAVSLMGCSISDEQVALLCGRGCSRVTLLLDGDEPGREAAQRMLPTLAERFFVHVARLPDGAQPDTVPEAVLRQLLELAD